MKVILIADVKSLGKKGDIVEANAGYARNFLFKKNLAVEATSKNMNDLALKNKHDEKVRKEMLENAKALAESLKDKSVTILIKTGDNGKAFGAVSSKEIAQEIKNQLDIDVDKKNLVLNTPLKQEGAYDINIKLHPEVTGAIKVIVKGKG